MDDETDRRARMKAAEQDTSVSDAALVSAARALGCQEVLSEAMAHGREIEGLVITNPFR